MWANTTGSSGELGIDGPPWKRSPGPGRNTSYVRSGHTIPQGVVGKTPKNGRPSMVTVLGLLSTPGMGYILSGRLWSSARKKGSPVGRIPEGWDLHCMET